jgi:hypothetical protein
VIRPIATLLVKLSTLVPDHVETVGLVRVEVDRVLDPPQRQLAHRHAHRAQVAREARAPPQRARVVGAVAREPDEEVRLARPRVLDNPNERRCSM